MFEFLGEGQLRNGSPGRLWANLRKAPPWGASRLERVGDWYSLGLAAGLGAAAGVLLAGLLARLPRGVALTALLALAAGIGIGFGAFDLDEAVAGAAGGALGGAGAALLAAGAFKRGGTRVGLALLLGATALVVAGIAFVPVAGYLEALALPLLGLRARARAGARYAGLRILARD
jgi:hypothetical protein